MKNPAKLRERIYINDIWRFSHSWKDEMLLPDFDDSCMQSVRLPHTNRELSYNYCNEEDYQELCAYLCHLYCRPEWKDKEVTITFEGAAHEAVLFVNGEKVLVHSCGYTAFSADLSKYLVPGSDNRIAIKLDSRESLNIPPFGRLIDYMTYGGLYREVFLEIHEKSCIDEIFAMPSDISGQSAVLNFTADLKNTEDGEYYLDLDLVPADTLYTRTSGEKPSMAELGVRRIRVKSDKQEASVPVSGFSLWSPETPFLYDLHATLFLGEKPVDNRTVRIGFRSAVFRSDGFYLNGTKRKIVGLDRHQSYPYVGYAMPASMQQMDADIMRFKLSLDCVRTSHYPQSQHFVDRCDENGLLVFMEIPGWQYIGDNKWKDQAVKNTEEMVTQYRNHASIILWGVRINESGDDDGLYLKTNSAAHRLDPFRQTGGVRNYPKSNLLEDVYTYNDFVHNGKNQGVDPREKITPDLSKGYLITEHSGHMWPTKRFDDEEHRLSHALRHAKVLNDLEKNEEIAGAIGWCLADYNTHKDFGAGDRICYHGVLDMFRNPKMAASVYESRKDPHKEAVLSVSSSMDIGEHPEGQLGNVFVFTNAQSLVFYENDVKIAEFPCEDRRYPYLLHPPVCINDFAGEAFTGTWGDSVIKYRVDALIDGKVAASVTKEPFSRASLCIDVYHGELTEGNSYDVAALFLSVKDQNGNVLSYYQEPLCITVEGPGEIIGPQILSLKGGMGGTYVKTTGKEGLIKVVISAAGIESRSVILPVKKSEV